MAATAIAAISAIAGVIRAPGARAAAIGGHRGWGYAPVYAGFYGGGCYTVIKARFVPGIGLVERPVRRCY